MKRRALQFGIVFLSASLLVGAGVLLFTVTEELWSANVLNVELEEDDETASLSYETRVAKGDQLFAAGYYEMAASEYALAIKIEPNQEGAHTKLGKTYLELGNFEEAVHELDRAYELKPSDDTGANYAISLLRTQNYELAENVLSEASENHQLSRFVLGMLQSFLGNYEEAKTNFSAASGLSGPVLPANIQEFQNAFTAYEAQQGGQTVYLRALLIKAMVDAEEYPMAEALALQVLNEKNDYRDVWVLLGYSQMKLKKYSEAEDAFKQAKSLDAVKPETHYFLGMAHYEQGEYAEAVDSFELALLYAFEPESEAYLRLAESQTLLGNYEDALAAYEYLVKIDQSDVSIFVEPIRLAMDIVGDLDRALTLAGEAISYFPSEATSHHLLASVYLRRGELELASTSAETALDIDPNFAEAHFTMGEIWLAKENAESAKEEFKKAYELSKPGDALSVEAAEQYNALILSPTE